MTQQLSNQRETVVTTPEAIISFPHVFEPWRGPDGTQPPKFSAILIFPQGTDLTSLKKAAVAALRKKWGAKAEEMLRAGQVRLPFRTDTKEKGYPDGATFVNARSDNAPGVVSRYPDPVTNKPAVITKDQQVTGNPNEIYSGCRVRALLSAFAYDKSGNRGVAFGLNGLQKMGDGQRLDNRVAAQDAFEADMSEAPPAALDDLLKDMAG